MFSYAPKHAIIWREYHKKRASNASGSFDLNILGTACGPEIIGTLEGIKWSHQGVMACHSMDTESGWSPMLDAVISEYSQRRGPLVTCQHGVLKPAAYTLGSMVLSEIVKQGTYQRFRATMTKSIGPTEGLFLDITNCRMPDGSEPFLSNVFGFGFFNLTREGLKVKDLINHEMDSCQPCYCKLRLHSEPKLNFYLPKFK
jgi:hypothetical protein